MFNNLKNFKFTQSGKFIFPILISSVFYAYQSRGTERPVKVEFGFSFTRPIVLYVRFKSNRIESNLMARVEERDVYCTGRRGMRGLAMT